MMKITAQQARDMQFVNSQVYTIDAIEERIYCLIKAAALKGESGTVVVVPAEVEVDSYFEAFLEELGKNGFIVTNGIKHAFNDCYTHEIYWN